MCDLSAQEREIYDRVENPYQHDIQPGGGEEKNAVGFVMMIYRRRLASSFSALRNTLDDRLAAMKTGKAVSSDRAEEDAETGPLDILAEEPTGEDVEAMERESLANEEKDDIEDLLTLIRQLPPDTKAHRLQQELQHLRAEGYQQVMVFTQYTDTMDFLREQIGGQPGFRVMCFSPVAAEKCVPGKMAVGNGFRAMRRSGVFGVGMRIFCSAPRQRPKG